MAMVLRLTFAAWLLVLAATSAWAEAEPPAQGIVRGTTERLLEELRNDSTLKRDTPRLFRMVNEVLLPHFDFERISRRVLGKYWKNATWEQKQQFVAQFQTLLVRTYAIALAEYQGHVVSYRPVRERSETEVSIRTELSQLTGPPHSNQLRDAPQG